MDTPYTVGRCKPFPGSGYPSSLPKCSMDRLLLSSGPSGASDWVGNQDVCDTARGITSLWIGRRLVGPFRSDDSPIRRIRRYHTNQPRYVQVSGLRRSAAYRWKPCSAIRRHGMRCSVLFRLHSQRAAGKYCSSPAPHMFLLTDGRGFSANIEVTQCHQFIHRGILIDTVII